MKKISVCMATYNGAGYVERQISSILSQLNDEDEIVISDDHSTDDTHVIVRQINDSRIKFYTNKLKRGPVTNFQNAIDRADGEYIFLADQDDVWLSSKIQIMTHYLEKYDLVLSDCEVVDANMNTLLPSFFKYRESKSGFVRNLYKNSYIGCCMAFRREVVSYALPFPNQIHMHDWWIGLLVELKGRVHFIDVPLMKYVRHGNNASPTGEKSSYGVYKRITNRLLLIRHLATRLLL